MISRRFTRMNADQNEEQFLIRVHPRESAANYLIFITRKV